MNKLIAQRRKAKRVTKRHATTIPNPWPTIEEARARKIIDRRLDKFLSDEKKTAKLVAEMKKENHPFTYKGLIGAMDDILERGRQRRRELKARKGSKKAKR